MPLAKQVWGDEFGMCVDQFGIDWLVNISQPQAYSPSARPRPPRPALCWLPGGRPPRAPRGPGA